MKRPAQKTEDNNCPKVGLASIITRNGKILLGERKGGYGAGTWGFTGGKLEMFESLEDCFFRELEEETGLNRENVLLLDAYPHIATDTIFKEDDSHYVTLYMRGHLKKGEPQIMEPESCAQWNWFYWDQLPKPLFSPINDLLAQGYNPFRRYF